MTRFIIRRLILSIPVLIGIVFLVFALARIIPGDPCSAALGERANAETCERYAVEHGLDKAIIPGVFRVDGQIELRLAEAPRRWSTTSSSSTSRRSPPASSATRRSSVCR